METYIIWGFLGSGKTTFINYLLIHFLYNKKVVILENESGKESVDGALLRNKKFVVKDMKEGCVCCSLRNELPLAIQSIYNDLAPDVLLIEPSGIASLEDLIKIPYLNVNRIITIVDVANYHLLMKLNSAFYKRQYCLSSIILLTKTDLVEYEYTQKIKDELIGINPVAFVSTDYHRMTLEKWDWLLKYQVKRFIPIYNRRKATIYQMETIFLKRQISINTINEIFDILEQNDLNIIRAKGFVSVEGLRILKVDYVCGKIDIKEMPTDFQINDYSISFWWTNANISSLFQIIGSHL